MPRRLAPLAVLSLLALGVAGCKGDAAGDANLAQNAPANAPANTAVTTPANLPDTNAPATNAPATNAPVTPPPAPAGEKVGVVTTKPGTGPAAGDGALLSMRYTGKLAKGGKVFDSNMGGGKPPFTLTLGGGQVIKGWEEGLQGIKAGERRTLTIPAAKGYGEQGAGADIPPNADLVFDVEAISVLPRDKQDTVERETVKPGTGAVVKAGDTVTFHYIGKTSDGTEFDNSYTRGKPLATPVGQGRLVPGMDAGLEGMKVGGKYRLTIPPLLGYGMQGTPDGKVPPNAVLVFDVEILKTGKG